MKTFSSTTFLLVAILSSGIAAADSLTDALTRHVWKMERRTGLGEVTTVWMFLDNGSGAAYQKVARGNHMGTHNHRFTYTVDKGQIIVQEEIAEQWEGYFGVTRWRLNGNNLVGEVTFRNQPIVFSPIDL